MYVKRVNPESCTASTASEDDTTQTGTEDDSRFPFTDAEKSERESELIEKLDGLSRFPEERSSRRESTTDPLLTTAAGPLPEPRLSLLRTLPHQPDSFENIPPPPQVSEEFLKQKERELNEQQQQNRV